MKARKRGRNIVVGRTRFHRRRSKEKVTENNCDGSIFQLKLLEYGRPPMNAITVGIKLVESFMRNGESLCLAGPREYSSF